MHIATQRSLVQQQPGTQDSSAYEQQRVRTIAENKRKMKEYGLFDIVKPQQPKKKKKSERPVLPRKKLPRGAKENREQNGETSDDSNDSDDGETFDDPNDSEYENNSDASESEASVLEDGEHDEDLNEAEDEAEEEEKEPPKKGRKKKKKCPKKGRKRKISESK